MRLQLVQNAAAWVLTDTRKSDQITPVLSTLPWLSVYQRIDFKILLLVFFKGMNELEPSYIMDRLCSYVPNLSLRSGSAYTQMYPKPKKRHGKAAFGFNAPKNKL